MSKDPLIYTVSKSLSAKECKMILDMFENDENRGEANVLSITINPNWSEIDSMLFNKLKVAIEAYEQMLNDTLNTKLLSNCVIKDTGYLIRKFPVNNGKYDWMNDSTPLQNRVLTYMWFINDVKEGGELSFKGGKPIKPKAGTLIIFPCTWNYFHSGADPISNDKFVISGHVYIHAHQQQQQQQAATPAAQEEPKPAA